jgi:hypothetical protein
MMRKTIIGDSASIAGFLLLLCTGGVQAALVNFTLDGTVDGSFGSPFGLNINDTITVSGAFDNTAISSSPYTVYFDQLHSGNTLSITAGLLTLNQTQDDAYALSGSPRLEFNGLGNLIGFSLNSQPFTSGALAFYVEDPDVNVATGVWNAGSFSMTPVPVPAAVWLLGSGLVGLVGVARRRKERGLSWD